MKFVLTVAVGLLLLGASALGVTTASAEPNGGCGVGQNNGVKAANELLHDEGTSLGQFVHDDPPDGVGLDNAGNQVIQPFHELVKATCKA